MALNYSNELITQFYSRVSDGNKINSNSAANIIIIIISESVFAQQ